ncbi:MAG TPA: C1 family peptidase [Mucilaginibacter sp.]|nr:C1 family peptidase [Mucilaginibacter sp.]
MLKPKFFCLFFLFIFLAGPLFAQHGRGMMFDNAAYEQQPRKAQLTRSLFNTLPPKVSLKMYAPYPKNQLQYSTCVAWASAYCGRTMVDAIKNNWTDRDMITKNAYSPAFLFRLIQPNTGDCNTGTYIDHAFAAMKNIGSIPYNSLPSLCVPDVDQTEVSSAAESKLKDYATLFDYTATENIKVQAVKKALSEKKPVVIGMLAPPSFDGAVNCWIPKEQPLNSYGGHAMCVVGYDDSEYGGAFEVQNSWGDNWGNDGYIWIRYGDFARFVQYAYEFVDLPRVRTGIPDLSGAIRLTLSDGQDMQANLYVSTRGLKVVTVDTTPQPLTIYRVAQAYPSGTNFRIYISNNQPAYVYAISSDLTNNVTKIFPYADNISAALDYAKNDVALPDEDHYIQFDNQPGTDFLCVLYSRNELDINQLVSTIANGTGTFNERVYQALADKIVDPANIKFSSDKISFDGTSDDKSVVALMVELQHK